jgi:predicted ribosomally synthesized peptide with SipW-like signal peptide
MTSLHDTARISRRKVLAGLGALGVASAGAGFGTAAFLSDREELPATLTAGRLDLALDYRATYSPWNYQPVDSDGTPYPVGDTMESMGEEGPVYVVGAAPDLRNPDGSVVDDETWSAATLALDACRPLADQLPLDTDGDSDGDGDVVLGDATNDGEALDNFSVGYVDGPAGVLFALDDVKPKDAGEATISFHVCGNPAYVWLRAAGEDAENTTYEPETEAGDTARDAFERGELDDFLWVRAFHDPNCSNALDDGEPVIYEGSLTGLLGAIGEGIPLEYPTDTDDDGTVGTCYEPGTHCIAVEWYLPSAPERDDGMGFAQLPSDAVDTDAPVNGEFPSLADELLGTFGYASVEEIDVNVVQSDGASFTLTFAAVQCRHNPGNATPFPDEEAAASETTDGDADADGVVDGGGSGATA